MFINVGQKALCLLAIRLVCSAEWIKIVHKEAAASTCPDA